MNLGSVTEWPSLEFPAVNETVKTEKKHHKKEGKKKKVKGGINVAKEYANYTLNNWWDKC